MNDLIPVPFRDTTLFLIDVAGIPYVPMKPVVEGMGLAWQSQHAKLIENQRFNSTITEIVTVAEDGKQRAMTCLPLRKLPGWLMTIYPNKVKPSIRDNILAYQNECDDVLWDYWSKGHAINPRTQPTSNPNPVPITPVISPPEHAANLAVVLMRAAKAFGLKGNQAVLSANQTIQHFTGINLLEAMGQTHLLAPDQEVLLIVSDIALRLNCKLRAVNPLLTGAGLQTEYRDHKNRLCYELTTRGHQFGVYMDTGKKHGDGVPVRQIKWRAAVIDLLHRHTAPA